MHDPSVLALDIKWLRLDIWHDEPGGHDSGEICGYPPHDRKIVLWLLRHRRHLHYRWWPYLKIKRWITDHCADCGRRFLWKDARFSYQGTNKVYHEVCMTLRSVRGQLDDLTNYARFDCDDNTKFRVERRFDLLDRK